MNNHNFSFCGTTFTALTSGALWWEEQQILTVSDLHLGKSNRMARRNGLMLPPYETRDTLARLEADIYATNAATVICLGDSFDDLAAAESLTEDEALWINRLQAGRKWFWLEGNHDPGPTNFGGTHLGEYSASSITFRHIAQPASGGEISGHYHPKATIKTHRQSTTRPCFLYDSDRVILPAYGTFTGGLRTNSLILQNLMQNHARAILTGPTLQIVPMPRD